MFFFIFFYYLNASIILDYNLFDFLLALNFWYDSPSKVRSYFDFTILVSDQILFFILWLNRNNLFFRIERMEYLIIKVKLQNRFWVPPNDGLLRKKEWVKVLLGGGINLEEPQRAPSSSIPFDHS
jgi:hypothetical protein